MTVQELNFQETQLFDLKIGRWRSQKTFLKKKVFLF